MSVLLKICKLINLKLETRSTAKFKAVIERPRIFTMVTEEVDGLRNHGFYHVCHPKLLLANLICAEYTSIDAFNDLLNTYVARIITMKVTNTPEYNKTISACAKCGEKIPASVASKLAIIESAPSLRLR